MHEDTKRINKLRGTKLGISRMDKSSRKQLKDISHPQIIYRLLFEATWATLSQFAKTEGLHLGMIAILHTWGQNLSLHPHIHCIIPGGGIDSNGNWKRKIKTDKYLFCVKALSKVFRAKFVAAMRKESLGDAQLFNVLFEKKWVIYAKNLLEAQNKCSNI